MSDIVPVYTKLAPSTPESIYKVGQLIEEARKLPQIQFTTEHMLHAGMYTRTIRIEPNALIATVLVKVPTVLIAMGDMDVWSNDELIHVTGYNVLPGSAGRKIAIVTYSECAFSMMFPSTASTVEEAEKQFTDEYELLVPLSDASKHRVLITGE